MTWAKEVHGRDSLDGLIVIGIIFLLINFYQSSFLLMFLAALLIIISCMSKYYFKHIDEHLVLENKKESIRTSVGEEFVLPISISQNSWLPIINAKIQLKLESIIDGDHVSNRDDAIIEFTIPIKLKGKERIQINLPLIAKKRGVTRIKEVEITILNFFSFGYVKLKHIPFLHKEVIIFPALITVPNLDQLVATKSHGYFPSASSMFEEVLAPIGTRDYVYSDPFQRIHWKASAKTQKLQTKVFERTAEYSWTFIINLRQIDHSHLRMDMIKNIETIASNVAFMARYASLHNIEYEIFLNFNMESGMPVYHLPLGGGKTQLGKTYEILARINRQRMTQPIQKLLHFVEKQQRNSPVVILCGPYGNHGDPYFSQMQNRGQRIYHLNDHEENPMITPYRQNERKMRGNI